MKRRILAVFTALALCVAAVPVHAAYDYFLKLDGIDGESEVKGHEREILIESFSWGVAAKLDDRGRTSTIFEPFEWTQFLDKSVPQAFVKLTGGDRIDSAVLSVNTTGLRGGTFFTMTFDDVLITMLKTSGSSGERPTANLAFDEYTRVALSYRPQKSDGSLGPAVEGVFDVDRGTFSGDVMALMGLFMVTDFDASAVVLEPIPEPSAYALLAAGLLLLGAAARRRV